MGHIHVFSSRMKLIIFFICIPLVYSELHRFMITYTEINGQTTSGTPEFSAVTTLDGQQIDYNDSNIMELIPRKNWMKDMTSNKQYTEIREKLQQIYKLNIHDLMQEFSQSQGVHTYQRMYGCEWDNETGERQVFDQHGYDGEDFISLDLKELRYITPVKQAMTTVMKWNNDKTKLETLKEYLRYDCVYWLRKFLRVPKATFADPPKVSLLQKKEGNYTSQNYTCHVTGFLFRNTAISWRKNGQVMSDSSKLVKSGDTLPNRDGTFQRRLSLYAPADECEDTQYTCVVEHKSLTEPIQKNMTVKKTSSSKCESYASYIFMHPVFPVIITVIVVLIVLCVLWKHQKKIKDPCNTLPIYIKNKPSLRDHLQALINNLFKKYSQPTNIITV